MRTNHDVTCAKRLRAAAAQLAEPPSDERKLSLGHKAGRADVQQRRICRIETERLVKLLTTHCRLQREERIESRSAADRDALGWKPVQRFGFVTLLLVPDKHPIRPPMKRSLRAQVVP